MLNMLIKIFALHALMIFMQLKEKGTMLEKHYSLKEASIELARIGIKYKPETIRKFLKAGELECFRIMEAGSSPIMIPESSLQAFIEKKMKR
jgi:hypothetical protein